MPYARPTLTQLRQQAIEDVTTSGVPNLAGLLRNAVLRVLAWVTAGLAYLLYGYLDWIARQAVPFTATDEYLEAWAALKGVYRKDATAGLGEAIFTGNNPNAPLEGGTLLTRQDGWPFTTTATAVVDASGTLIVPIVATQVGAGSNCDPNTPIGINSPVTGINSGGLTYGPVVGGADQETQDELRTRMLIAYATPPQGGAMSDYIEWATSVPGCTRAFVEPGGMGVGTVVVFPMFDDVNADNGGFPKGTNGCAAAETRGPAATGDQLLVANYIWPRQPVPVLAFINAPLPWPVDVVLDYFAPFDDDVMAAAKASVNDMFRARAQIGGTIYQSDVSEAIADTPGINHFIVRQPGIVPTTAPGGYLPVLGNWSVSPTVRDE